jgi:hypothetical protein
VADPLHSLACPERALRAERVFFVVRGFVFPDVGCSPRLRASVVKTGFFPIRAFLRNLRRLGLHFRFRAIPAITRDFGDYLALVYARPIPPIPSTSLISPASFMRFNVL